MVDDDVYYIFLNVVFELLSIKGEYRRFENVIQEGGRSTDELKKKK
jgi:hypothetical protein